MQVLEKTLTEELIDLENKFGAHNYHQLEVEIDRAERGGGYDVNGQR